MPPWPVRIDSISVVGLTRTQPGVVRRELLFAAGDTVHEAAVRESERNLRRLLFLGDVRLEVRRHQSSATTGAPRGHAVVRVRDLYSRAVSPLAAGDLSEPSFGITLLDYNLFGAGQTGRLTAYRDAITGARLSLLYRVPRAAGRDADLEAGLMRSEDGHEYELVAQRPFRHLATPWSANLRLRDMEDTHRLYSDGGHLAARYVEGRREMSLGLTRSWGTRVKLRPGLSLSVRDQEFDPDLQASPVPVDRRRVAPSASLILWRPEYARTRFLHALGPLEDVQTGPWLGVRMGASLRSLGSDRSYPFVSLVAVPGGRLRLGVPALSLARLTLSSRWAGGRVEHVAAALDWRAYVQPWPGHTLALGLGGDAVARPEDEAQFLIGVDGGIRGHRPRTAAGQCRAVAHAEARPLLWHGPTFAVAGAAFVDGGAAWSPGDDDPGMRWGLGAGLRLGLPRVYATPVLRIDVARGFPNGVTQLVFGTGHYF